MARRSPIERRIAALKKRKGLRPRDSLPTPMSGKVTFNVMIPDIEHGSWSFIGQPFAPDFKDFDFL